MFKKIKFNDANSIKRDLKKWTMCRQCYSFYYKKTWHFEAPKYFQDDEEQKVSLRFSLCTSCVEQETALYERDGSPFSYGI